MRPSPTIAVLFQALSPPVIGGVRKDPKPGGYSDSGADIACCLAGRGASVLPARRAPDPAVALDWVFPDTTAGIQQALDGGATLLWANTVLFSGHPIEDVMHACLIVGQHPAAMQAGDDKFATNALLRSRGLPVASSVLAGLHARPGVQRIEDLTEAALAGLGLSFPLVVKPVRGRGSQGVSRVADHAEFLRTAAALLDSARFGDELIVEQFLAGTELTVTVMPGGGAAGAPWALPPVCRFNHLDGIAPYNGDVAVTQNSRALTAAEQASPAVQAMLAACVEAARQVGARAPIRIDCRADAQGVLRLFDLNMKPNMTGAGRPGREDQDSLSAIAARAIGWSYGELLACMLASAWREPRRGG